MKVTAIFNTEGELRGEFGAHLRANSVIAEPIESGTTGLGIPDMYIRTTKVGAWVEFKNLKYPLYYPLAIPFRPRQFSWLTRHWKLGGMSLLIIGTLEGIFILKDKQVKEVYTEPLIKEASLRVGRIDGGHIVSWIDSFAEGHRNM